MRRHSHRPLAPLALCKAPLPVHLPQETYESKSRTAGGVPGMPPTDQPKNSFLARQAADRRRARTTGRVPLAPPSRWAATATATARTGLEKRSCSTSIGSGLGLGRVRWGSSRALRALRHAGVQPLVQQLGPRQTPFTLTPCLLPPLPVLCAHHRRDCEGVWVGGWGGGGGAPQAAALGAAWGSPGFIPQPAQAERSAGNPSARRSRRASR